MQILRSTSNARGCPQSYGTPDALWMVMQFLLHNGNALEKDNIKEQGSELLLHYCAWPRTNWGTRYLCGVEARA